MYRTNTTTTIFIHTIQAQKGKTKKGTIYTIWFCVQRRKAFELTAAYLQIMKGTKDTDNNFNYYIKDYFLKCRKTKLDTTTTWIWNGRLKLRLICEEMIFTPLLKAILVESVIKFVGTVSHKLEATYTKVIVPMLVLTEIVLLNHNLLMTRNKF